MTTSGETPEGTGFATRSTELANIVLLDEMLERYLIEKYDGETYIARQMLDEIITFEGASGLEDETIFNLWEEAKSRSKRLREGQNG